MVVESTKVYRYGTQSVRQMVKHYVLSVPKSKVKWTEPIVYIHGGAWVGETHTYDEFSPLINRLDRQLNNGEYSLSQETTQIEFFAIDYRLSPEIVHPHHILDVLEALHFIHQLGTKQVSVVGHSAGSTMITQIMEHDKFLTAYDINFTSPIPSLTSVVFLDGIYSIKTMLEEYPSYEQEFVSTAFKTETDWLDNCNMVKDDLTTEEKATIKAKFERLRSVVVTHSTKDELLSTKQPETFCSWLESLPFTNYKYIVQDMGLHNQTYESDVLLSIIVEHVLN
ncbi:hypothetical protein OGAPHI_002630 [Ogataea philodendri]|uniref:BD-FAE-like domain-containing protein n=1 Tax=Ogataea philodendri TaxID=1378263 RepID=A0A9P8PC53_9ASCO|nr:uncharacterized protein OGAPHI_002630 [Ogataea philodendri]KAH3668875.1 hypothetical protein OGAPHI_002630 [Ogataea philodendri]